MQLSAESAGERLFPGVDLAVSSEVALLCKRLATLVAHKGLFPCVSAEVHEEV